MGLFIDSFAWIEYFMGTDKGLPVKEVLDSNAMAYTSPTVVAEIFSKSLRTDGREKAEERVEFILDRCVFIPADEDIAIEAGKLHGVLKPRIRNFGLADSFILAAARSRDIKVMTGDLHFKDMDETVFLE